MSCLICANNNSTTTICRQPEQSVQATCDQAHAYFSALQVMPDSLIVFDIDDTALYNYHNHEPAHFIWSCQPELVAAKAAIKAPAINPVLALYKALIAMGFKIVFISGRHVTKHDHSIHELASAGYSNFECIILTPDEFYLKDKVAAFKSLIRKQLAEKYTIVGCVGDRAVDFVGGYTGYEVRLPNYLY